MGGKPRSHSTSFSITPSQGFPYLYYFNFLCLFFIIRIKQVLSSFFFSKIIIQIDTPNFNIFYISFAKKRVQIQARDTRIA